MYDEDETVANGVATKLVQRDFDNVFLLSGGTLINSTFCIIIFQPLFSGLKVLFKTFPRGIVTGCLPPSCRPSPVPRKKRSSNQPVHASLEVRDYFTMDGMFDSLYENTSLSHSH